MNAFQVDIDVLGTANSFVEHKIIPVNVKYPWANQTRSTMQLERARIENEAHARLVGLCYSHWVSSQSASRGRKMEERCSWLKIVTSELADSVKKSLTTVPESQTKQIWRTWRV